MKPWNAAFRPFASCVDFPFRSAADVMDFARALEDLGLPVIQPWSVLPLGDESRPPTPVDAAGVPRINIGEEGPDWRAWLCAYLRVPPVAQLVDPSRWGAWRIQLDSDGLGNVWVDGRLAARELFLHGEAELNPARPDCLPWVAHSLDMTIQNVRLEMARASLSGLAEINGLVRDVARSLRAAASLLMTANPRVNRFLAGEVQLNRSPLTSEERGDLLCALFRAAGTVDIRAFVEGDLNRFLDSVRRCRDALAPLAAFAKRFTVFLFGVSHIDLAWKWRWAETIECMRGTLADQVAFMARYPDFTFLESSPPVWIAMKERDPALYEKMAAFGRKGQLEPAGGMWCEPDGQMLGAESWVRQTLYGQRAAKDILGAQSVAGHNTDAFGFTWALPKIYAQAEMEAFLTQKLRYNEFTIFEEVLFWWESDDGSRVLGVHTYPDHYQEIDPDEIAQAARIFHLTSGVYSAALLFGIGNHGGGPRPDMFERIEAMRKLTVFPNVLMAGMPAYLEYLKSKEADALAKLPVIRDELFLECHHKTYTVQARVKTANRALERKLYDTEAMAVMAGIQTAEPLRPAWEIALFNQFHDILPGTSFPMVYADVYDDYARAQGIADSVQKTATTTLLGVGNERYVINTLPWRRPAVVTLPADDASENGGLADDTGREMAVQKTAEGDGVVAVLQEAPAFGVRGLRRGSGARKASSNAMDCGETWAQNGFFRVEFDPAKGYITSLKLSDGAEIAGEGIGRLDLLEDSPKGYYQTWNMNLTGREDHARCGRFERIECGSVRTRFRAQLSFGRWEKKKLFMVPIMWRTPGVDYPTSFFVVDYIIYKDLPWIECVMRAEWWEDDTDLKVAACTSLTGTRAFYAIPFGKIERPTRRETMSEKAKYEVPGLSWADLTDGAHGLAILNTGRHGHDALGGRLRLTLLTSPYGGEKVHVPDPLADRGRHEIRYAFYPHVGGPDDSRVARVAMEYEYAALTTTGADSASVGEDLLVIDPDKVLVSAVKPAEDGEGIIVRCYEPHGRESELKLAGRLAKGELRRVNSLEHDVGLTARRIGAHEIVAVSVRE